jgi:hypothetical protein
VSTWPDDVRDGLAQTAADLEASAAMHELLGMLPAAELARWREAAETFARAARDGDR